MSSDDDQGPLDKAEEVKDEVADKLEPTEDELSQSGGAASASSPFSDGERPGEQQGG